jgi:hypothetical protein
MKAPIYLEDSNLVGVRDGMGVMTLCLSLDGYAWILPLHDALPSAPASALPPRGAPAL